ncbi:unnamed protein product [Rhizophagus irregularis]|nr:unnamed protein product [Rhizophagus irregularis]CAB4434923.1 unnamed protein product [Rhizophagus irregularis]
MHTFKPLTNQRASHQPMLDKRFPVDLNATVAYKAELLFGECEFKLRNIFTEKLRLIDRFLNILMRAWYEGGIMTDLWKAFYNQV